MSDADELDVERLACAVSAAFDKRIVELAPDDLLPYDAAAWQDAIVFVTAGEIELECSSGERHRFGCGDILCLTPLPVRALRNTGRVPARLLAIRRQACSTSPARLRVASPVSSSGWRRHTNDDFDPEQEVHA